LRVPDPANPTGWTTVNIIDSQVQYNYDALGRLATVTTDRRNQFPADFDPENPTLDETVTYSYNAVGSLKSVEYPNGNYAYYRYDGLNRLRELTNFAQVEADPDAPVGAILSRFAYSLYADGQRSRAVETLGGSSRTVAWQYDGLNRLVRETVDGTQTDEYVYDLAGNRLCKISDGTPTYYFYDVHDRLDRECSDADGLSVLVQYGYDLNGSQTGQAVTGGDETVYSYSLTNRLAAAATGSNPTVSYRYNPDGIRIQKSIAGVAVTHYTVDPFNPTGYAQVLTSDDGTNRTYYVLGSDIAGQAVNSLSPTYYLYDGHGSVRQDADASGSVLRPYHYDAYGNAEGFTPDDGLYYAGEMFDADLGQYYLRARYYNPSNGLFNRVDPYSGNLQDPQSLHKYLYCHANPVNGIDPSGMYFSTPYHGRIVESYGSLE
jgi:RHS repeat-associated protein